MEKTGCSFSLTKAESVYEAVFQRLVFVILRWLADEVQKASCCGLVKGRKYVIVLGLVGSYLAQVKLCFGLCEPYSALGRPESGELKRYRVFFCH